MKVAVIGGGVTGLVAAYEISKKGNRVFVFEKAKKLGGLTEGFRERNWQWTLEEFFHHFFTSDNELRGLLKELGLIDELFYRDTRTSSYFGGTIYPFDTPIDLLRFPHLKMVDKLRMGLVIFFLRLLPYFPFFEKNTVSKLFPKLIGKGGWETIWQRLMEAKFGDLQNEVSFSWIWARLKKRSKKLGYIKGGTQVLLDSLKREIESKKGKVFLNSPVTKIISLPKNKWEVVTGSREVKVDKIVVTTPLSMALDLVPKASVPDSKGLSSLETIGALTLVLRLKNEFLPGDTYWLNILEREYPFVVVVEHTNFIDSERYGREHLVYVGGYYHQKDPIFTLNKEQVFRRFSPFLRRLSPSFEKFLIDYQVFSYPYAQPVVPTNYSKIKPSLEVSENLYWANTNHIYPWDRGVNFSVLLGKKVANLLLEKK